MSFTTITSIESFDDPEHWMGYKITMSDSRKNITCKIEKSNNFCENWGVYTTSYLEKFIGAKYHSVHICEQEDMLMINVTVKTNRGNFVLHLFNEHSGYCFHDVLIQSENGTQNFVL